MLPVVLIVAPLILLSLFNNPIRDSFFASSASFLIVVKPEYELLVFEERIF